MAANSQKWCSSSFIYPSNTGVDNLSAAHATLIPQGTLRPPPRPPILSFEPYFASASNGAGQQQITYTGDYIRFGVYMGLTVFLLIFGTILYHCFKHRSEDRTHDVIHGAAAAAGSIEARAVESGEGSSNRDNKLPLPIPVIMTGEDEARFLAFPAPLPDPATSEGASDVPESSSRAEADASNAD